MSDIKIEDVEASSNLSRTDQALFVLPQRVGLFWVEWLEDERAAGSLAVSGPVLCNDIEIGEPPAGTIAACVPFATSAVAKFVPDPRTHCRE